MKETAKHARGDSGCLDDSVVRVDHTIETLENPLALTSTSLSVSLALPFVVAGSHVSYPILFHERTHLT